MLEVALNKNSLNKLVFTPPPLGTVLYMPGLPGGGRYIHDRSPYGNVGTIIGAVWKRTEGGLWYLEFDGTDDWVRIPDDTSLDFGDGGEDTAFSIEAWVNFVSGGDTVTFSKGANATRQYAMWILSASDKLRIQFWDDSSNAHLQKESDDALSAETWLHIVMTYDATEAHTGLTLYVNGSVINATGSISGAYTAMEPSLGDATIGRLYTDSVFAGEVHRQALTRVHNIVLPPTVIAGHYQQERHLFGV